MSQKGFIPIFILVSILILVILGVGSYLYFGKNNTASKYTPGTELTKQSSAPKQTLQSKTVEPLTETEGKNWKIYTNKDFTIKYPQEIQIENRTTTDWFGFKTVSLFTLDYSSKNAEDKNFYSISFAVIKDANKTTPEEIARKDIVTNSKGRETQTINSFAAYSNGSINGLYFFDPGEKLDGKRFGFNHDIIDNSHAVVIEVHNNTTFVFYIRGNNYGLSNNQLQIFDKVLSTFNLNQPILVDKPLDQLIQFTLPEGWKLEKQSKDIARQASGALVIKSPDYDDKNPPTFMHENRPGSLLTIYKNYGGSVYTRDDKYKQIYDEIHDPNPGGATSHDLTKLTIGGYPAISYLYTFEGYEHTYNIWQDDNIWTILITAPPDQSLLDKFLSSITFDKKN